MMLYHLKKYKDKGNKFNLQLSTLIFVYGHSE